MAFPQGRLLGLALVGLQGVIFLAVGVTALLPGPSMPGTWWAGVPLAAAGGLVMVWSGKDLGRALTPLPQPNGEGLAGGGIYARARHPMYAGILLIALGLAVGSGHLWTYAFAVVLMLFFEVKTRVEEAYLVRAYPGYADYARRTGKFLPGVGRWPA